MDQRPDAVGSTKENGAVSKPLVCQRMRRPRLRVPELEPELPAQSPRALQAALAQEERMEPRIVPGAEACIQLVSGSEHLRTRRVYLYLHGLSACRQETSPVTEQLAQQDGAHAVFARVAGHGMGNLAMGEVDGAAWLESVWRFWLRAIQLGERVVIVATSTGAAYARWLLSQPGVAARVTALLLMAPNFKVRHRFAFLLAWPGAEWLLPHVVNPEQEWQDKDPRQRKYWATNYGNRALIQMQLLLNTVRRLPLNELAVPLMVQASRDDPVVNAETAYRVFKRWRGQPKRWLWVQVPAGESAHVFVGDIMAPQRNAEVIAAFQEFLMTIPEFSVGGAG